ncbi:MAG: TRAP transporter small permease [Roseovarius sp.]|nr:TRAP transporter small permease [Roseovarius sp.]
MKTVSKILEYLAFLAVMLGGVGLMISMFLGVGDVVGTWFNRPLLGAFEITESTMVLIVFGGLAYAQIRQRHLRVELFYILAGPRLRSTMDIFAALAGILFFSLLTWQGWNEALFSLERGEATTGLVRLPLYPARFSLVFGSALLIVVLTVDLIRDIWNFGNPRDFDIAAGG